MEKTLQRIEYTKKNKLNLTADNISDDARAKIARLGDEDNVVLRVRVNSPVFIEAAAPLTSEGIKEVCTL